MDEGGAPRAMHGFSTYSNSVHLITLIRDDSSLTAADQSGFQLRIRYKVIEWMNNKMQLSIICIHFCPDGRSVQQAGLG